MKYLPRLACCSAIFSLMTSISPAQGEKDFPEQSQTTIGPDFSDAPETKELQSGPRGDVREFTMDSKDSKIYKGIAKDKPGEVPYQRKVAVYIPARHRPSDVMPFIVVQDGIGYRDVVSKTLDNLIDQKRVPAQVAIFINSGGGDSKGSERGLEYDTVDGTYTKFIADSKSNSPAIRKAVRRWAGAPARHAPSPWHGSARISIGACSATRGPLWINNTRLITKRHTVPGNITKI